MKVIHVTPGLGVKSGGPSRSVFNLVKHLREEGLDAEIVTMNNIDNPNISDAPFIKSFDVKSSLPFGLNLKFGSFLVRHLGDIFHIQCLYTYPTIIATWIAQRKGIPYIVAPRGMLYANALKHNAGRKKVFNKLFQIRDLNKAAAIHVTCKEEMRQVRDAGVTAPVAIIPNSISIPEVLPTVCKKDIFRVGFLGRINSIKNIDGLLRAWDMAGLGKREDLELVIVGGTNFAEEVSYLDELHKLESERGITNIVWKGALYGEEKDKVLETLSCMVLCSHSENFGMSVVEAMLYGIPVIAAKTTPWSELNEFKCGWWVDNDDRTLSETLQKAVSLSDAEWLEMATNGQQIAVKNYSAKTLSQNLIQLYQWVLEGGLEPEFVYEINE